MKPRSPLLLVLPVSLLCLACDRPVTEPQAVQAAAVSSAPDRASDIDTRLLSSLNGRRSWSAKKAGVDLDRPELRVELANPSGQRRIVDAWSTSPTARVPMLRVDWSDQLYELTPAEWSSLRRRAGK